MGISHGTPDVHHGFKLRSVNPATGVSPMPTVGAFAQSLPAGFETRPVRVTDGTVHVCLEGAGEARISGLSGDFSWRFQENDVFVAPSWHALQPGRDARFPVNRVFCVGRNDTAHAREMGKDPDREPPFFCMKPANAESFAKSAPIGALHRAQDIGHPAAATISVTVNRQPRQSSQINKLIWSVAGCVARSRAWA